MAIDVLFLSLLAGCMSYQPPAFIIEGMEPGPSIETLSSQLTGDSDTTLVARRNGGRVRIGDVVADFSTSEDTLVTTTAAQYSQIGVTAEFSAGNAVWFTEVAVQHRKGGAISIVWVPGEIAVAATATYVTAEEIKAYLGDNERFVILGDVRFHRSADTVVAVQRSLERRPAYVDDSKKTGVTDSQAAQSSMSLEYRGTLDLFVDLTALSALGAGDIYIDDVDLPRYPFGGKLGKIQVVPFISGVGVAADKTIRVNVDGVALTGNDAQLLVADMVVGNTEEFDATYSNPYFDAGSTLSLELEAENADFTAGMVMVKITIWECVP